MSRTRKSEVEQAIEDLSRVPVRNLLPSGCDVFNLACSGSIDGFIEQGLITNLIGDKNSGKTFLALTISAAIHYAYPGKFAHRFKDYENALHIDIAKLYGKGYKDVLIHQKKPNMLKNTIERWQREIEREHEEDPRPQVIITDSFDAMICAAEVKAMKKQKSAESKGEEEKQNIGMTKAKASSERLKVVQSIISERGSILIIISQIREKTSQGSFSFGPATTRSGGKALGFYSAIEAWLTAGSRIGVDKLRPIGHYVDVRIARSKVTGKTRFCTFPIVQGYGVDSTRASVMYLAREGYFTVSAKANNWGIYPDSARYDMPVFRFKNGNHFKGTIAECCRFIEEKPERLSKLRRYLQKCWDESEQEVENEATGGRSPKFTEA